METKKTVLIVDDNQEFCQMLQAALEDDYTVFAAFDGNEGINSAVKLRPDVILMDVMMPNISGIEMARALTAEEETRSIPIIVLTASALDRGTPAYFKQEPNVRHFLSKDTPVQDILNLVGQVLEKK